MGRQDAARQARQVAPEPEKPRTGEPVKTFYLGWDVYDEIERLGKEWGVSDSAAARWLLQQVLVLVEEGTITPKIRLRTVAELE